MGVLTRQCKLFSFVSRANQMLMSGHGKR